MENANIVIFEDHDGIRKITAEYVASLGHTVTATAATLESSLATVDAIGEGQVACDAVILDGNLRPRAIDGDDAAMIAARMRELHLPAKIIGYSLRSMEEYGVRVDYDTQKDMSRLKEALQIL